MPKIENTNCKYCNNLTPYLQTELCPRCWELERRIDIDPKLAIKILLEKHKSLLSSILHVSNNGSLEQPFPLKNINNITTNKTHES